MAQTVSWAIGKAFLHAQRKSTPPAAGTSKHSALLQIADSMQKLWATEDGVEWGSLYSLEDIGTVTATDSFDLDDEIDYISKETDDPVRIVNGTQTKAYKIVKASQLYKYRESDACAQVGRTLKFSRAFASTDSTFGGTIQAPCILAVEDITASTDEIQVDRPMWLAYMMAAEFVRNDVVKQAQYENLLSMAEEEMNKMREANDGTVNEYNYAGYQMAGEDWV